MRAASVSQRWSRRRAAAHALKSRGRAAAENSPGGNATLAGDVANDVEHFARSRDFEPALLRLSLLRICLSDVPFISFVSCAHHDLCTPK
jgi:hypothetical protein